MKIYLEGGNKRGEFVYKLTDKKAISQSGNKTIMILNYTRRDPKRIKEEMILFSKYFLKLGAKKVYVASNFNKNELHAKLKESGLIYLPGGDTKLLMRNLKEKGLVSLLKNSFEKVIIGNSAGAIVLCNEGFFFERERTKKLDGIGLAKISIYVHYTNQNRSDLKILSKDRKIYPIPERKTLIIENGKIKSN
ncbi:MAG: Type 1 glutamine amidotransferase-like domain-containing protein [Nanoarchaeota archaeon]|nr:Type 1 glutamine amidotransferase-like domain-containing protein [Nanoarchaeota archaeon]